jgi:hypothetical protein
MKFRLAVLMFASTLACAQTNKLPAFTGSWTLDIHRCTFEGKPHPPIAAATVIRYDGTHWHRSVSHTSADGKVDAHVIDLIVDSPKPRIEKDGPLTFYSKIRHDGDALILMQNIVANTGEKATNSVRYTLEEHGNVLIESEQEITPAGNETNRWVSTRKVQ